MKAQSFACFVSLVPATTVHTVDAQYKSVKMNSSFWSFRSQRKVLLLREAFLGHPVAFPSNTVYHITLLYFASSTYSNLNCLVFLFVLHNSCRPIRTPTYSVLFIAITLALKTA